MIALYIPTRASEWLLDKIFSYEGLLVIMALVTLWAADAIFSKRNK